MNLAFSEKMKAKILREMKRSKDIFLEQQIVYAQMQEAVFLQIPEQVRHQMIDWQREPDDYEKLKEDKTFCELYKKHKEARKKLNERKYQLRNPKG